MTTRYFKRLLFVFALAAALGWIAQRAHGATIAFSGIALTNVVTTNDLLLVDSALGGTNYATRTATVGTVLALTGGGSGNDLIWMTNAPATDMEGGTIYTFQSTASPDSNQWATVKIALNNLTNFWGSPGAVVRISGAVDESKEPAVTELAKGNVNLYFFGDSNAHFIDSTNSYDLTAVGANNFPSARFTNVFETEAFGSWNFSGFQQDAGDLVAVGSHNFGTTPTLTNTFTHHAFGYNNYEAAYVSGGTIMTAFGDSNFRQAIFQDCSEFFGVSAYGLEHSSLTNSSGIWVFGGDGTSQHGPGYNLSGTYNGITLIQAGSTPAQPTLTSDQLVMKAGDIRLDGPTTVTSTLTTGDPGSGTAAWKLGAIHSCSAVTMVVTQYVEVNIGGTVIDIPRITITP